MGSQAEAEAGDGVMYLVGFDDAYMGTIRQFNTEMSLYDYEKIIESLMEDMSKEDAVEYFEFNVVGAWMGPGTPAFFYGKEESA